jgi:hypothetical protein
MSALFYAEREHKNNTVEYRLLSAKGGGKYYINGKL